LPIGVNLSNYHIRLSGYGNKASPVILREHFAAGQSLQRQYVPRHCRHHGDRRISGFKSAQPVKDDLKSANGSALPAGAKNSSPVSNLKTQKYLKTK
jgi:hypothetical protein